MSNLDMKNMVLGILDRRDILKNIHVKIGAAFVGPNYFHRVRDAVAEDRITIEHARGLSVSGKYIHQTNTLKLKFNHLPEELYERAGKEALILHELTHAAHDIRGLSRRSLDAEACAYVVQYLYYYYRLPAEDFESGKAIPPFNPDILTVEEAAWNLSKKIREESKYTFKVPEQLFDAIKQSDVYRRRWMQQIQYDGVPH